MYKRILLPVDGSEISLEAAKAGIELAKVMGAEVVALNVTQPFSTLIGFDGMVASYAISDGDFEEAAQQEAKEYLEPILDYANAQQIKFTSIISGNYNVAEGIVAIAEEQNCDLIYMATHGRSGLSSLLLGSVTNKVISLAKVSVMVYRTPEKTESSEKSKD
ncbi:universal stress protein [Taylorella equigenitalis]|uniref:Universal stress protein n=3 Tax=Taylorella equigenitalis TaxID=29575 RepID=A0ABN4AXU4_9BURK|nr:universal stress protein [Taylorella equigenitalis]ADU91845.1 putative universal stress protein [Taylorella equigenitalis MCE9]AFN35410.1 putative universal stress protein [Taylorella equigenitalis ATCC 35865]ASY30068.1 universal stress protein [Taylorella equigenitalis]ASY37373.1 universal stress protein [Taylorella equigenitalis]ASY38840.1 universal stress protein [Taylorella equigenitalis]